MLNNRLRVLSSQLEESKLLYKKRKFAEFVIWQKRQWELKISICYRGTLVHKTEYIIRFAYLPRNVSLKRKITTC